MRALAATLIAIEGAAPRVPCHTRSRSADLRSFAGQVRIGVARPLIADLYADNRATGSFILIDEATHHTVAGGMISEIVRG